MDLGTMEQNIKEHRYTTVDAFRRDILQVSIKQINLLWFFYLAILLFARFRSAVLLATVMINRMFNYLTALHKLI